MHYVMAQKVMRSRKRLARRGILATRHASSQHTIIAHITGRARSVAKLRLCDMRNLLSKCSELF